MKKGLAMLLAGVMAISLLTGCGGKKEEAPAPAVEETTTEETAETPAAAPTDSADLPDASGDPVVTLIFSGGSFDSINEAEGRFKEQIESLSGGSIQIDWHPRNELGGDREIIEQVSFGDIDMGLTSPAAVTTMMPNLSVFDAYYLITSQEIAYEAMDGEIGQQLDKDALDILGIKCIAWCENGFRNLTVSGDPVTCVADLKGRKIRTMENELHMEAWKALGANPTPMAFGEVFTAMQQGAIDGQENPLGIIASNSFMDVQSHLILSQHVYTPMPIYINNAKYESMTDAQKAVFDYCAQEMETWQRARNLELNEQILKDFEAQNVDVIKLDDAAIAEFQKTINDAGVYDKVRAAMTNPELLDKLMELGK